MMTGISVSVATFLSNTEATLPKKRESNGKPITVEDVGETVRHVASNIPWWGKILLGVGGGYLIITKVPILELLQMFFFIFLLPIMFLGSCGLAVDGILTGLMQGWNATLAEAERMTSTHKAQNKADKAA